MTIMTDRSASEKMLKAKMTGHIQQWCNGCYGEHWYATVSNSNRWRKFISYKDARRWLLRYVYIRNITTL